jgi:hypothetical protein
MSLRACVCAHARSRCIRERRPFKASGSALTSTSVVSLSSMWRAEMARILITSSGSFYRSCSKPYLRRPHPSSFFIR